MAKSHPAIHGIHDRPGLPDLAINHEIGANLKSSIFFLNFANIEPIITKTKSITSIDTLIWKCNPPFDRTISLEKVITRNRPQWRHIIKGLHRVTTLGDSRDRHLAYSVLTQRCQFGCNSRNSRINYNSVLFTTISIHLRFATF